jgi:rRNA-processing protein FCF1
MNREDIEQAIYERTQEFVPQCVYEAILELIASEREAYAKQLDALGCDHCATAIRARGQA